MIESVSITAADLMALPLIHESATECSASASCLALPHIDRFLVDSSVLPRTPTWACHGTASAVSGVSADSADPRITSLTFTSSLCLVVYRCFSCSYIGLHFFFSLSHFL